MLCIALVAVFAFDVADSSACTNAECTIECDFGACTDHEDRTGSGAEHHCCHGTVASETSGANKSASEQVALRAEPVSRVEPAADFWLDALERPPRVSTAI